MHGFLNVMLASALLFFGGSLRDACEVMREEDASSFLFDEDSVRWRDHVFSTEQVAAVRRDFFRGFGSCSLTEPLDDSKQMGWTG